MLPCRDDVDRKAADVFRLKVMQCQLSSAKSKTLRLHLQTFLTLVQVIAAKETGKEPPIKLIEGTNFVYIRHEDLYLVACSRSNANPGISDPCTLLVPQRQTSARVYVLLV